MILRTEKKEVHDYEWAIARQKDVGGKEVWKVIQTSNSKNYSGEIYSHAYIMDRDLPSKADAEAYASLCRDSDSIWAELD